MKINCRHCSHYYISWDRNFPYGCKAFGIKTKIMPSIEIYNSSGKECLKFEAKEKAKK